MQVIFNDFAKISFLGVKPRFRKSGVASKVLKEFIELCKTKNISSIKIDAHKSCLEFWEKQGFEVNKKASIIDGTKQNYHNGIYKI